MGKHFNDINCIEYSELKLAEPFFRILKRKQEEAFITKNNSWFEGINMKSYDENNMLKKHNKELLEKMEILERTNLYYHEEQIRMKGEIDELNKTIKKLKAQKDFEKFGADYFARKCKELEEKLQVVSSSNSDTQAIVVFLYSGIENEDELIARHKILQKLFHPDNFRDGEEVFKTIQNYYECIRYRFR